MADRATTTSVKVSLNTVTGKIIDTASRMDGYAITWNETEDKYYHSAVLTAASVTFEQLDSIGDVGTGADQLAYGNHTHSELSYLNQDVKTTASPEFAAIQLTTGLSNPSHLEGSLFYDNTKKALSYYNDESEVTINLGQEVVERAFNDTGSTILNGTPVYLDGMNWKVATSKTYLESRIIGITTHDIEDQTYGYATIIGEVSMDLSLYSTNDAIYLGDGVLTNAFPSNGNFVCRIGVVKDNSVNGILFVRPIVGEYTAEAIKQVGWPSSHNLTVIPNAGTRTLSLTPTTGSEYYFYQDGIKYIKNSDSIVWADIEGIHVFYYESGVLSEVINPSDTTLREIRENNPGVINIYWDATNLEYIFANDARHHFDVSSKSRSIFYDIDGCTILEGIDLNGFNINGTGNDLIDIQFGHDSGVIRNQDLITSIPSIVSTTGFSVFWRSGASDWRRTINSGISVLNTGTGLVAYNNLSGGVYQLTEASNGYYVPYFIVVSNTLGDKTATIPGNAAYSTKSEAVTGALRQAPTLLQTLLRNEISLVAIVFYETRTNYTNVGKARLVTISDPNTGETVNYIDLRSYNGIAIGGGSGGASSFLGLLDTPSAYSGHGNELVQVDAGATGLEFIDKSTITLSSFNDDLDVTERSQDAVGGILSNEFTYNDTTPSIALNYANISHTSLQGIGTNTHSQIDSHIGESSIHYTQASISIPASQITDFDTEVSNNTDVAANTSARHTAVTVTDSSTIDFTLTTQNITASVIQSGISLINLGEKSLGSLTGADDIKAIEALAGTSGLLRKTAANTWTLDTNDYLTTTTAASTYVPLTRTVAGKALSSNITLASTDLTDTGNLVRLGADNVFTGQGNRISSSSGVLSLRRTNDGGFAVIRMYDAADALKWWAGLNGDSYIIYRDASTEIFRLDYTTGLASAKNGYAVNLTTVIDASRNFTGVAGTFTSTLQATTAKLTNLSDGYIPYHVSDASGLANSPILVNGSDVTVTGAVTSGTSMKAKAYDSDSQTVTYSSTPTMNTSSGINGSITLTGNVTTFTLSNLADGRTGDIVVIQNATGGYGISAFAASGLTVKYLNAQPPTAAYINSAANAVSVVSYKRVGSYLFINYAGY